MYVQHIKSLHHSGTMGSLLVISQCKLIVCHVFGAFQISLLTVIQDLAVL